MEDLLKSGLINLSALAVLLYPDKTRAIASAKLLDKIKQRHGQSLSDQERERIFTIVQGFGIKLYSALTSPVLFINEATEISPEVMDRLKDPHRKPKSVFINSGQIEQLKNNKYL